MLMLGAAFFGTLIFLVALFVVIMFGAAGNKWEKDIRAVTKSERDAGLVDAGTLRDLDMTGGPHVPAHA
ncbi:MULTISPECIES: hypothetical protein [Myxococcus]|uniref:hypothetical protein n=1 Tax=Myxococcus TaxID=32 RepID=UPI0013D07049|nr:MULTISPECIES: hypothetical protein [Myxococcus]NVJ26354.1 hypothetical protein [Myxococcus sp. AM011]